MGGEDISNTAAGNNYRWQGLVWGRMGYTLADFAAVMEGLTDAEQRALYAGYVQGVAEAASEDAAQGVRPESVNQEKFQA